MLLLRENDSTENITTLLKILTQKNLFLSLLLFVKVYKKRLNKQLTKEFTRGYSISNLECFRKFYLAFQKQNSPINRLGNLDNLENELPPRNLTLRLSWTH